MPSSSSHLQNPVLCALTRPLLLEHNFFVLFIYTKQNFFQWFYWIENFKKAHTHTHTSLNKQVPNEDLIKKKREIIMKITLFKCYVHIIKNSTSYSWFVGGNDRLHKILNISIKLILHRKRTVSMTPSICLHHVNAEIKHSNSFDY